MFCFVFSCGLQFFSCAVSSFSFMFHVFLAKKWSYPILSRLQSDDVFPDRCAGKTIATIYGLPPFPPNMFSMTTMYFPRLSCIFFNISSNTIMAIARATRCPKSSRELHSIAHRISAVGAGVPSLVELVAGTVCREPGDSTFAARMTVRR